MSGPQATTAGLGLLCPALEECLSLDLCSLDLSLSRSLGVVAEVTVVVVVTETMASTALAGGVF